MNIRSYIPGDDEPEPGDFDEYHDIPATGPGTIPARGYMKIERDPARSAALRKQQAAAILEFLRWVRDKRANLPAAPDA